MADREANFYKNEYENLRRAKNKEIRRIEVKYHNFWYKTLILLKSLGISEEEIIKYYE